MKIIIISLIAFLVCILSLSFFTMPTFYLFSPIEGTILSNGKPVANTKVVRTSISGWFDGSKKYREETTTDENGKFSFPVRTARFSGAMLFSWLPHEANITQEILLDQGDKEYRIWGAIKFNYTLFGELIKELRDTQTGAIRISCSLEDMLGWDDKIENAVKSLSKVQ